MKNSVPVKGVKFTMDSAREVVIAGKVLSLVMVVTARVHRVPPLPWLRLNIEYVGSTFASSRRLCIS